MRPLPWACLLPGARGRQPEILSAAGVRPRPEALQSARRGPRPEIPSAAGVRTQPEALQSARGMGTAPCRFVRFDGETVIFFTLLHTNMRRGTEKYVKLVY